MGSEKPHRVAESSDPDNLPPQIERDLGPVRRGKSADAIMRGRATYIQNLRSMFDEIDDPKTRTS